MNVVEFTQILVICIFDYEQFLIMFTKQQSTGSCFYRINTQSKINLCTSPSFRVAPECIIKPLTRFTVRDDVDRHSKLKRGYRDRGTNYLACLFGVIGVCRSLLDLDVGSWVEEERFHSI